MPDLFKAVARLGLFNLTLAAFADWWRTRDEGSLTLFIEDASGAAVAETTGEAVEAYAAAPRRVILNGETQDLAPRRWTVLNASEVQP